MQARSTRICVTHSMTLTAFVSCIWQPYTPARVTIAASGLAPVLRRHPNARIIMPAAKTHRVVAQLAKTDAERGVERQIVSPRSDQPLSRSSLISPLQRLGLVTSRSETFGYTIVEPMAGGRPVIGTRCGSAKYLIMDYFTGIGFAVRRRRRLGPRRGVHDHRTPRRLPKMGENAAGWSAPSLHWTT